MKILLFGSDGNGLVNKLKTPVLYALHEYDLRHARSNLYTLKICNHPISIIDEIVSLTTMPYKSNN